jgi:hypothetical protein
MSDRLGEAVRQAGAFQSALERVEAERDLLKARLAEAQTLLRQASALLDAIAEQEPTRAPHPGIPIPSSAFFKAIAGRIKKALPPAEEPR